MTTSAATSQMALRVADRARTNHFEDAHPDQPRHDSKIEVPAYGHQAALSGADKQGFVWTRTLVCACDWEITATGRSPLEAGGNARALHRRHVSAETDRTPGRDYLVLLGLIAVVGTLLMVLASVTIGAATG